MGGEKEMLTKKIQIKRQSWTSSSSSSPRGNASPISLASHQSMSSPSAPHSQSHHPQQQQLHHAQPPPPPQQQQQQQPSSEQAGIGVLFVQEEEASGFLRVTVKALIRGGAAEKSGAIQPGDMVVKVDGHDVIGQPLSMLRNLIPGPIGSICQLGFLRGVDSTAEGTSKGTFFDVKLARSIPDPQGETTPGSNSRPPSQYNSQEKIQTPSARSSFEKRSSNSGSPSHYNSPSRPVSSSNSNNIISSNNNNPPLASSHSSVSSAPSSVPISSQQRPGSGGRLPSNQMYHHHQHHPPPHAAYSPHASPSRVMNVGGGGGGASPPAGNNPNGYDGHRSFDMAPHAQIARENDLLRRKLEQLEDTRLRAEEEFVKRKRELERRLHIAEETVARLQQQLAADADLQKKCDILSREKSELEQLLQKSEEFRRDEEKKRQQAETRCRQLEMAAAGSSFTHSSYTGTNPTTSPTAAASVLALSSSSSPSTSTTYYNDISNSNHSINNSNDGTVPMGSPSNFHHSYSNNNNNNSTNNNNSNNSSSNVGFVHTSFGLDDKNNTSNSNNNKFSNNWQFGGSGPTPMLFGAFGGFSKNRFADTSSR